MKELDILIKKIQSKKNKIKCFFLGNTKKRTDGYYYITPIRENKKFIFFGAVVFNDQIAKKILKKIDGKFDYVFIDIEKKIKSKNIKNIINIERTAKDIIKKSVLYVYKANDLAVFSTETLLNNLFLDDQRGIGGKKILIVGCGNIGTKLALKFVESGGIIDIYRRNIDLSKKISYVLNKIKPNGTLSNISYLEKLPYSFKKYDIIITSINQDSIIKLHHVEKISSKTVLIDLGKGNFSMGAINFLINRNYLVFRLDTTSAYFSYIENMIFTFNQYNYKKFRRKYKKYNFVSQGILGAKNDLIVDNIYNPKKILGVCDGRGGLQNLSNLEKKKIILVIKKFGIKIIYD